MAITSSGRRSHYSHEITVRRRAVAGKLFIEGRNYVGHNYIGHNSIGHNYIGHNYIGREDDGLGHNYIGP